MGRIITAEKAGRLSNVENALQAYQHAVARDMNNFFQTVHAHAILIEAVSRAVGKDKVEAMVKAIIDEKRAEEEAQKQPKVVSP